MFEASFKVSALVESDELGQRVFKVYEHAAPVTGGEFTSILDMLYQQDVFRMLEAGDSVTVRAHLDFPLRDVERTLRFREDQQFEGEGLPKPTPDLLLLASAVYEPFIQKTNAGEVLTVAFDVQRP